MQNLKLCINGVAFVVESILISTDTHHFKKQHDCQFFKKCMQKPLFLKFFLFPKYLKHLNSLNPFNAD